MEVCKMVNIGDYVRVIEDEGNNSEVPQGGVKQEVLDIAYKDEKFVATSAKNGTLMYWLKDYGWVHASHCETDCDDFFDQDYRSPELEDLGYKVVGWRDGLEDRPDNSKLPEIVTYLMAIQYHKEGSYGSSWKGKGEYRGIMANIDRKYDRLDKMTQDEINGNLNSLHVLEKGLQDGSWGEDEVGESKIDAIADFTNYGLLYMTYVRENFPNVFNIWVKKNIPPYLADKIKFI